MSKAKIVKVGQEKEVTTKNGLRWKYPLELENGTKQRSSLQSKQNPFKEGMEINYELVEGKFPEIKVIRPKTFGGGVAPKDYSKEKILKAMEYAVTFTLNFDKAQAGSASLEDNANFILNRFEEKGL